MDTLRSMPPTQSLQGTSIGRVTTWVSNEEAEESDMKGIALLFCHFFRKEE